MRRISMREEREAPCLLAGLITRRGAQGTVDERSGQAGLALPDHRLTPRHRRPNLIGRREPSGPSAVLRRAGAHLPRAVMALPALAGVDRDPPVWLVLIRVKHWRSPTLILSIS